MEDSRIQTFVPVQEIFVPNIMVLGAGGAGGNVVTRMVSEGVQNVRMVVCNTDQKALQRNKADVKIDLGRQLTRGMGAGARPEIGAGAAEDSIRDIENVIKGSHMIFIAAGMGGGTGTGAAPVIAKLAREKGILTVGVVTKPFQLEGKKRITAAEQGIAHLVEEVDSLITIPNQKLMEVLGLNVSMQEAFAKADDVLRGAVQGISDIIMKPGYVNVDFADVKTVMSEKGIAMMGTGVAVGKERGVEAASQAIGSELLEDINLKDA